MNKLFFLLITLLLISGMVIAQDSAEQDSIYTKYYYSLEITEYAVARENSILNRVSIGKAFINEMDSIIFLDPDTLYYSDYDRDEGNLQITLRPTAQQKDSIFILTRELFDFDCTTGTKDQRVEYDDGSYGVVELYLDKHYSRFSVSVGLDEESLFRERYLRLKDYILSLLSNEMKYGLSYHKSFL